MANSCEAVFYVKQVSKEGCMQTPCHSLGKHRGIFYSVHSHVEFFYFVFHSKHIVFFSNFSHIHLMCILKNTKKISVSFGIFLFTDLWTINNTSECCEEVCSVIKGPQMLLFSFFMHSHKFILSYYIVQFSFNKKLLTGSF